MNYWYLAASLPQLTLGAEPASSFEAFRTLCGEHLTTSDLAELDAVLAGQGESAFARALREYTLRVLDECAVLRAAKLGIDSTPWRTDIGVPDASVTAQVRDAMGQADPRARELQLDTLRWKKLEELAQPTPFGLPAVLSHGLRLQIALRWAARNEASGRQRLATHLEAILTAFDRLAQEKQK